MAETKCSTCLAVAAGGRIRLTADTAALLEGLVHLERKGVTVSRRLAMIDHNVEAVTLFEAELKLYDSLLDEIHRTQAEKGWASRVELLRSHPEGPGSPVPQGPGQPMG